MGIISLETIHEIGLITEIFTDFNVSFSATQNNYVYHFNNLYKGFCHYSVSDNMADIFRLSGASSVGRQPEGAGKWFAEFRAHKALRRAGFVLEGDLKTVEFGNVDRDEKFNKVGEYHEMRGSTGLVFDLYKFDQVAEEVAYKFGSIVNKKYE